MISRKVGHMNNEWQELDPYNLPPDILNPGAWDGEQEYRNGSWAGFPPREMVEDIIKIGEDNCVGCFRIRRHQPKAPSHDEIMTKWWFDDKLNMGQWVRVFGYCNCEYLVLEDIDQATYHGKSWFSGRQSADIPPEAS